jgi:hypothetical protein
MKAAPSAQVLIFPIFVQPGFVARYLCTLARLCIRAKPLQHRVVGMVSTTIGYRIKLQQNHHNKKQHAPVDFEFSEAGTSTSPGHAQSSDNSAETEYCPYARPAVASVSSAQLDTSVTAGAEPRSGCNAFPQKTPVDLAIQRKSLLGCTSSTVAVTPSTIIKRRSRIPAAGRHVNCLTMAALSCEVPPLDRQASDATTVCKSTPCGKGRELMKRVKVSMSSPSATGILKPCSQSSASFGLEHRGMPVNQRVIDACRPTLIDCGKMLPTANRTPMKPSKAAENQVVSPCRIDDSDFSDVSDCDDCFSEQAHVPIALLDAFSPVRPRAQLNASESRDFELEFGWDPVVRNAVMKNTFNGFGAIRSH